MVSWLFYLKINYKSELIIDLRPLIYDFPTTFPQNDKQDILDIAEMILFFKSNFIPDNFWIHF